MLLLYKNNCGTFVVESNKQMTTDELISWHHFDHFFSSLEFGWKVRFFLLDFRELDFRELTKKCHKKTVPFGYENNGGQKSWTFLRQSWTWKKSPSDQKKSNSNDKKSNTVISVGVFVTKR